MQGLLFKIGCKFINAESFHHHLWSFIHYRITTGKIRKVEHEFTYLFLSTKSTNNSVCQFHLVIKLFFVVTQVTRIRFSTTRESKAIRSLLNQFAVNVFPFGQSDSPEPPETLFVMLASAITWQRISFLDRRIFHLFFSFLQLYHMARPTLYKGYLLISNNHR